MALEQDLTPTAASPSPNTGMDNEIAAYRAISPAAILSLICGVLAILSFTSWTFLAFTVAAIFLGVRAERRIQRDPEIWTGRKLAQAGISLGLIFGLAAVTSTVVQDYLRAKAASQFAAQFAEVLRKGNLEDAAWFTASPAGREGKKPIEIYKEMTAQQGPPGMPDEHLSAIRSLKDRLGSGPQETVVFEKLERHGVDGMNPYAAALYKVQGPGTEKYPEKEQFALFIFRGVAFKGKTAWWVESSKFPYEPASYVPVAQASEGGHGHAH